MSRIHEALKKAELERASAQGTVESSQKSSSVTAAQETIEAAKSAGSQQAKPAPVPEPSGHLRFEDLEAHLAPLANWKPDLATDVFDPSQEGHGAEQFRTLRSRLYQVRSSKPPLRTLLVTSSVAGEGKTFVTGNLVRAIVRQPERRVLVIDADLRCSRLHHVFGAPSSRGLSDYLRGGIDEARVIQRGSSNLCFIPSGSRMTDPSELLSNGRMKLLLERLGPAFDWVIIDAPPCLPVADAGVLANWCDGLLLVVRAGYTPSAVISRAKQELKGRNVVGVVLNAVADDAAGYGSYYAPYYGSNDQESAKASR